MKKVKFYYSAPVHIRHLPVLTNDNGDVLYVYEKTESESKRVPRVTVASCYDPETRTMTFGVAVCSVKDVFIKRIGRELAEKRAKESPKFSTVVVKRNKIREVSRNHAMSLISECLAKYIK